MKRELTPLFSENEGLTADFLQDLKPNPEPEWQPSAAQRQVTDFAKPIKIERSSSVTFSPPNSSYTFASAETITPLKTEDCGLSLLDLPPEAMHKVYRCLVNDPSIQHDVHAFLDVFKVARIAHICRTLRDDYLTFLLSNFAFKTDLKWLPRFVATFGRLPYVAKASLIIFYDPSVADSPVDLLPVLELQAKWPSLSLLFEIPAPADSRLHIDIHLTEDFNYLLEKCCDNITLSGHIKDQVLLSLEFHSGSFLQRKYSNSRLTQRIQIGFKCEYEQLWMDGTHSFDELQHFLTVTGLVSFNTLDVWVGIASLGATGKDLRVVAET